MFGGDVRDERQEREIAVEGFEEALFTELSIHKIGRYPASTLEISKHKTRPDLGVS